jgi:predicted adenylyl cyclase CyaB
MKNLEAKFRLADLVEAESRATPVGYTRRGILNQRDTFFRVADGKLKLREEDGRSVLIFYRRDDSGPLMLSEYQIASIVDPATTRDILHKSLGTLATVEKVRILLMRDNVRLHLDRITSLGDFGEIEAVIADGEDPEHSRAAVDETLSALGIATADLIDISYFEMFAQPR